MYESFLTVVHLPANPFRVCFGRMDFVCGGMVGWLNDGVLRVG